MAFPRLGLRDSGRADSRPIATRAGDPSLSALAEARPISYWLDGALPGVDIPGPQPALTGRISAGLAVVGGGFTGLWTALLAKERDPSLDVVLLEGREVGWAASGRNGGFCAASLTHGLGNGMAHFPGEMPTLERLGEENLTAIEETVRRHGIDCDFEPTGELCVATDEWQVPELAEHVDLAARFGQRVDLLDRDAVRAEIDSPTYLGGAWDRDGAAMLDPAKLAWGLKRACLRLGVRVHEHTPVRSLCSESGGPRGRAHLGTPYGSVVASRVALGTNAFPPLLRRLRPFILPVYDYVLVTESLGSEQLASIGWRHRQGLSDSGNQFHYYRLTSDNRILWGGYDAVYYYGDGLRAELDQRPETFARLARHFFTTFPQLEGVRFTHAWGGAIDTCSRFCPFFGTAHGGRVAYVAGYTGLGVGATRFGAQVMLDLLSGQETELTRLRMVRTKPVPFPPEPLRYGVVALTRASLARADARGGRRDLWLRTLDRFGVGFDS